MNERAVGIATKIVAIVIALRSVMNLMKPFGAGRLVFFGHLLDGVANTIIAPALGLSMLALAYGMWTKQPFALPLSIVYAIFVTLNVPLFVVFEGIPAQFSVAQYGIFALLGVGGAWLAPWLLSQQKTGGLR
jgi:hypothetical protein